MGSIRINRPGFLTTVQDKGRFGQQWSGISPAGAMDADSMCLANLLVGNDGNEAVLEVTIMGPEIEFDVPAVVAITGADLSPTLDGNAVDCNRAVAVGAGQRIAFGPRKTGCRAYIAFAGGLDVPLVFGSRSTLLRNSIGGINNEGQQLKAGDQIGLQNSVGSLPNMEKRQLQTEPTKDGIVPIRVILGPQDDCFTQKGIDAFLDSKGYLVTEQCNRQGYRLQGERIEHSGNGNIVSDGIAMGAVQVPPDGLPIIMMAERQSTGGYPKIANVITVDLPKIAQAFSGSQMVFSAVSVEEAHKLLYEKRQYYKRLTEFIQTSDTAMFNVRTQNNSYRITVTPLFEGGTLNA